MSKVRLIPLILAACTGQAVADATLTYELSGPDGASTTKTLSIARFFARIDDTAKEGTYLIYQAGKFFPLYEVKPHDKAYTRLTPEVKPTLHAGVQPAPADAKPAASTEASAAPPVADTDKKPAEADKQAAAVSSGVAPETVKPVESGTPEQPVPGVKAAGPTEKTAEPLPKKPELKASREKREIAGVECRVVEELKAGKTVLQHCMANKARLGITEREIRTLSRTFVMARERAFGWLGAATEDEEFVSIQTRDPETGTQLVLKHVSTEPLPQGHLKIPREYKHQNP